MEAHSEVVVAAHERLDGRFVAVFADGEFRQSGDEVPKAVGDEAVLRALAQALAAFDGVDEEGGVGGLAGIQRFLVRVDEGVDVGGEAVAVGADGADVFVVVDAVGVADEEAVEGGEETLDFAHVAVADVEVFDEFAFCVADAVPGSHGGCVAGALFRVVFFDFGDVF